MSNELTGLNWGVYIANDNNTEPHELVAAAADRWVADNYAKFVTKLPNHRVYTAPIQQAAPAPSQAAAAQAVTELREYQEGFEDGGQSGRRNALQDLYNRVRFMYDCLPEVAAGARNQLAAVMAMIESSIKGHYKYPAPAPAEQDQQAGGNPAYLLSMVIPEGAVVAVDGRTLSVIDPSKEGGAE